mmetsp:Transcript_86713/g.245435  ORF Transcript_86713/g.245435 Transcript_86713/m.245435 type:complete len:103 (+) Transcript_86713:604-912(+)
MRVAVTAATVPVAAMEVPVSLRMAVAAAHEAAARAMARRMDGLLAPARDLKCLNLLLFLPGWRCDTKRALVLAQALIDIEPVRVREYAASIVWYGMVWCGMV